MIVSPPGPLPKNWGCVLVTVSPCVKLSKITLVGLGVPELEATLNLDEGVEFSGKFKFAAGF